MKITISNGRYVKSSIIAKAIEDAYKGFTMQHKYPFTVLHFTIDGTDLDVNVHPTKMEVRFSKQQEVYNFIYNTLKDALSEKRIDSTSGIIGGGTGFPKEYVLRKSGLAICSRRFTR